MKREKILGEDLNRDEVNPNNNRNKWNVNRNELNSLAVDWWMQTYCKGKRTIFRNCKIKNINVINYANIHRLDTRHTLFLSKNWSVFDPRRKPQIYLFTQISFCSVVANGPIFQFYDTAESSLIFFSCFSLFLIQF